MTFNPMMAKAVVKIRQFLPKAPTVLEFGNQTLTVGIEGTDISTVEGFYKNIGFKDYFAIDMNEKFGSKSADLNSLLDGWSWWPMPEGNDTEFDLVTNNGTGEHIFNQHSVFSNIHYLCKKDGLMLHVLPWINWQNHGFYNFHPTLFYDLADANGYEILDMYAGDRDGNITHPNLYRDEIKKPDPTDKNVLIVVALKKTSEDAFKTPIQGKYQKDAENLEGHEKKVTTVEYVGPPVDLRWPTLDCLDGIETIETNPFPHIVGHLDEGLYKSLAEQFPSYGEIVRGRMGDNVLLQVNAAEALRAVSEDGCISPLWKQFIEYHTSDEFLQTIIRLFGDTIRELYPQVAELPLEAGVRFRDDSPFHLDCQFAVNTLPKVASRVRGPHIDNPVELYAGMIYFPIEEYRDQDITNAGGELMLFKWRNEPKFIGKAECEEINVVHYKTIRYKPGNMIFWINSPQAVHGVSIRVSGHPPRRYVNIIGEVEKPLFELPK